MEAARIDSAGIIRTYTSVMLPLSLPGFVVVNIFQFTNIWNLYRTPRLALAVTSPSPVRICVGAGDLWSLLRARPVGGSNVITGQQAIWASNGSMFVPGAPFAGAPPAWVVQP
jgi:hypothetical protein